MWWKIAKLAGLFFLGFGAAQDIKYQKISTEYLLAGSCAVILYRALFGRMHWSVWVAGLGCGSLHQKQGTDPRGHVENSAIKFFPCRHDEGKV